ncbi:uncharacterized protein K441DRAFT_229075 [Cenococcum geophilum 1.58]|uniref:uncharacterized protein n=1 Tax=Cenococcum geophilum 1.58 TaxID=794803 RepID=UPI00358F6998|nr:hypothetical protein K441DRAFT_229075 [Cenococcum geophilum 1.58]
MDVAHPLCRAGDKIYITELSQAGIQMPNKLASHTSPSASLRYAWGTVLITANGNSRFYSIEKKPRRMLIILFSMNYLTRIWMTSCPTEGRNTAPPEKRVTCAKQWLRQLCLCTFFSVIRMWAGEMKRRNTQNSGPMSSGYPSDQPGTTYQKGSQLLDSTCPL